MYQIDKISYDYSQGLILKTGEEIKLTNKQKDLLNYFIDNPKKILSKQKIMEEVWGRIITENSVDQFISTLRGYLEENPSKPKILVTHFGKGMSFEGAIKKVKSLQPPKSAVNQLILLFLSVSIIVVSYFFFSSVFVEDKKSPIDSAQASPNRMLFITNINDLNDDYNQNSATQQLISELLRLSNGADVVDTSRFMGTEKKQELTKQMWQLNPNLKLVKTQLQLSDKEYVLSIEVSNGLNPAKKQHFRSPDIHKIVLDAANYLAKENSQNGAFDTDLLTLLPEDKYLVETYMRGFSFTNKGETAKAIEYFNLCLQEKPDFHLARLSLAKALRRHSQYDESIAQLEALRSVNLNESLTLVVDSEFAAVELLRGHLSEAKSLFEKIITAYPLTYRLYPAYMNLAATDYRMGNYDQALERLKVLEKTINEKTHPEDAALIFNTMSAVYLYQKQLDESFKYINKSYELFKKIGDLQREGLSLARLSIYYFMIGDLQKAEIHIRQSYDIANQLGNKRSQQAALNHMVEFKLIEGKFDEASKLNVDLTHVANEIHSLPGQTRAAQWDSLIAIEKKQFDKAQRSISQHWQLAQTSQSKPSINTNLILQLQLAIAQKNWKMSDDLIQKLLKLEDKDFLTSSFIPLYIEYLSRQGFKTRLFNVIEEQKKKTGVYKDKILLQKLAISLAEEHLKDNPKKSIELLKNLTVNDLIKYPYYSVLAEGYYQTGDFMSALVQMEKAKKSYNQRWNQELQELYNKIRIAVKAQHN